LEAASKKRGRPKFEAQHIQMLRAMHVIVAKSNRQAQTWVYYAEATKVLGIVADVAVPSPFPHLVDWEKGKKGVRGAIKYGVMAEIGRMARQLGHENARTFAGAANDAFASGACSSARDAELKLRAARLRLLDEHKTRKPK
jgi:hypothetical protein